MTGERVARPLQAVELVVNFGTIRKRPRKIIVSQELLAMLSEEARRAVMDEAIAANQRFKTLIEELYWDKGLSLNTLSKFLNISNVALYWWMKCKLNIKVRDRITASQLASTKHAKRDFDGSDVEKLATWFLAHTDGSVIRNYQQVEVILMTPDPYLALLFKEVFGKYGYVGVAPHRNDKGEYMWELWILLPLRSYWWLLERRTPTHIDSNEKLYSALNITVDAEGSLCARSHKGRATEFKVVLYNEKVYVVEPLYGALKQHGYRVHLYTTPKGKATNYGRSNNDYYYITVCAKADVKRLLENVEPVLPHKRLKVYLIKSALRDPSKPVYWSAIEPVYSEGEAVYKEVLRESKQISKSLYERWRTLTGKRGRKQITYTQCEEERNELRAEAWRALEALKMKYDERFKELEKRIEAYFRAQKPLKRYEVCFNFLEFIMLSVVMDVFYPVYCRLPVLLI
ncbi:MAG: hypothetical protein QXQ28_00185 [Candidatus Nezhaarchaeales archaeon]